MSPEAMRIGDAFEQASPYDQAWIVERMADARLLLKLEASEILGLPPADLERVVQQYQAGQMDAVTIALRLGRTIDQANDPRMRTAIEMAFAAAEERAR